MITNNYSLTINGYECKLNKPLKFYQGDSLHLIFTVNQYEWVINNGNRVRAIMPINPLKAFLIIENPEDEATDTIESAFVENDEIHFHIDSKYTSFVGVGRMQLVLADDGCCSVTIPEFTYEIKKNITDKLLNLSKTTLIDTDNKVLMTDSGDDMITGLALSTESNTSKYIKDLPNKEAIDGQESVLIQDQEGTKNVNMKVLLDDINSRTNLTEIQNQIIETNTQLSTKAPKSDVNNIQQQLNNLVLGAVGDGNNAEVVQARGQYSVINDRLNATDNQINRLYEDYYMNLVYSPLAVVVNQKFINHSGVITSSSALARYITVPIKAKNPLYIHSNYGYPLQKGSLGQIQILDKDYNVLSVANDNLVAGYDVTVDNVGSDACYARFNTAIAGNDYVGQLYVGQIRYHEHYMEDKLIDIKYNSLRNDFTDFTSDLNSAHVKHKTILTGSKNYINGELVNVMSDNVYANDIVYDESLSITSLTFKVNVKVAGEYTYTLYTLEKNTNTITGVHDVILSTNNVGVQEINVDTNGLLLPSNNYLLIKYVDDNCALTYTKNGTGGTLLGYKNVTPEKGDVITSKESMNGLLNYKLTYRIIQSLEKSLNTIEVKLREINDDSNSNNSNNRLYGQKIVAIGDSMVKGHTLNENQTWLAKIANRNNMTYVNYGINGGFLSRKPGLVDGCDGVCDRYTGMDDDADYVVVFAGTNDAASQVTLGDESSVSKNEFYGALVQLCKGLLTKYPTKRILFITPYRKYSTFKPYIEAIEVVCGSYGIPVFNNEKRSGISWAIQAQKDVFTLGDNTHLNEAGHEYVSYRYEEELRRL